MIRRRRLKVKWFLTILFSVFICVIILYQNLQNVKSQTDKSLKSYKIPKKSLLSVVNVSTSTEFLIRRITTENIKHITKSMAQLGKMDEISKHFLFLNYVPKSGSEILTFLLEKIQGINNFKHIRLRGGNKKKLTKIQQEYMVDEIYEIRRNMAVPLSFDTAVYFINFTSFDKQLPTYVNLIRHPITKVMARSFLKKTGTYDSYFIRCLLDNKRNCSFKSGPYDLTIPYFCGHDPRCMVLNNNWALATAKQNVEKFYRVVGVLEELNKTLDALEDKIPHFFSGAKILYRQNLLEIYKHKRDPEIPEDIRRILEETLVHELEFYEWVKRRLLKHTT